MITNNALLSWQIANEEYEIYEIDNLEYVKFEDSAI